MANDDWKSKYLSLADEQEAQAKSFEEAERLLCRTITRVAVATVGLNPALDPSLKGLQTIVRNGYKPDLRKRIDELADELVHISDKAQASPLERIIQRLVAAARQTEEASDLWLRLSRNPADASDGQLDRLVELIVGEDAARSAAKKPDKPASGGKSSGGLFGRLLKKGADEAAGEPPNQVLSALLETLQWPEDLKPEIVRLRGQLDAEDAQSTTWTAVVSSINEMVMDALGQANSELRAAEDFLAQLSGRLQELDGFVQGAKALRDASRESGQALGAAVRQEMGGLSNSMQQANDLQQLKQAVAQRLDAIQSNVQNHLRGDEDRYRQVSEREQELEERLKTLEGESEQLRQQISEAHSRAYRDAVTGLPNRMAYDERIEQEFARYKRFGKPLALAVWDIDDFKKINDKFGHRAGDKALKVIGRILQNRLRETDFIARYGGEEFVTLLVGSSIEDARRVTDMMRLAVANAGLHSGQKVIPVTISCGLTEFGEGDSPAEVFERADQALYQAKGSGKNKVVSG